MAISRQDRKARNLRTDYEFEQEESSVNPEEDTDAGRFGEHDLATPLFLRSDTSRATRV
jgi:hypothetical protein